MWAAGTHGVCLYTTICVNTNSNSVRVQMVYTHLQHTCARVN